MFVIPTETLVTHGSVLSEHCRVKSVSFTDPITTHTYTLIRYVLPFLRPGRQMFVSCVFSYFSFIFSIFVYTQLHNHSPFISHVTAKRPHFRTSMPRSSFLSGPFHFKNVLHLRCIYAVCIYILNCVFIYHFDRNRFSNILVVCPGHMIKKFNLQMLPYILGVICQY